VTAGPANAAITSDGSRRYTWAPADGSPPTEVLSVTSIRRLLGTTPVLVEWQTNNLLDTIFGTTKREWRDYSKSKKGRKVTGRVVEVFPSEFAEMYAETSGLQAPMDEARKWLRDTADHPKNIAGVRGTIVHKAIERNIAADRVDRNWVEATFADLTARYASVRNYWDMRVKVPFVIIAREPQVFNLTMGYGGSLDAMCWFLPPGCTPLDVPKPHQITQKIIASIGGTTGVGDWKTSKGIYTDQVVQTHAYGGAEFVGENGVIDHRLTDILQATTRGVLFHIRPNQWGVHRFEFTERVFHAFAGSVAFARFIDQYERPDRLFAEEFKGNATEEEEDE
jgi:hypothetical protein